MRKPKLPEGVKTYEVTLPKGMYVSFAEEGFCLRIDYYSHKHGMHLTHCLNLSAPLGRLFQQAFNLGVSEGREGMAKQIKDILQISESGD
jgi:hypothetical protein